MGVCHAEGADTDSLSVGHFEFDRGRIAPGTANRFSTTWRHLFTADEAPRVALEYCAYDVLLVSGAGLVELGAEAMRAMEDWTRAGGSLAVVVRSGLSREHEQFLDRLTSEGRRLGGMVHARLDLGRVIVATEDAEISDREWFHATNFLWRIRRGQRARLENGEFARYRPERSVYRGTRSDQPLDLLQNALGLSSVRVIPWWGVLLVLTAIVILIGPAEVWALKRLRRRTLTWVTFPVTCLAATVFIVWLSTWTIGSSPNGVLEIYDLGAEGRVLRRNSYQSVFPVRHRQREWVASNELCTAIGSRQSFQIDAAAQGPTAGRYPQEYTVTQSESKWTPYLFQRFSIGGSAEGPVPALEIPVAHRAVPSSFRRVGQLEPAIDGLRDEYDDIELLVVAGRRVDRKLVQGRRIPIDDSILSRFTISSGRGVSSIVGSIAPTGGSRLDDVAVLEEGGASIAVLARRDSRYVLFRRSYPGEEQ